MNQPARTARVSLFLLCAGLLLQAILATHPAHAGEARRDVTRLDDALAADLSDGALDRYTLAQATLIASGVSDEWELERRRERLDAIVAAAVDRAGNRGRPEARARRLLAALHREALREYRITADGMIDLLDNGTYNCVSATLLFLLAAQSAGLPAAAAETPLHVFVTLPDDSGPIAIEATSPPQRGRRTDLAASRDARPLRAEQVVALLYRNSAVRAMREGLGRVTADNLLAAAAIEPQLPARDEEVRTMLAWAVRELYDDGAFSEALEVAEASLKFLPDRTTVKDRLIAVTGRTIEQMAARGDMAAAVAIQNRVLEQIGDAESRDRLTRFTAPLFARAAESQTLLSAVETLAGHGRYEQALAVARLVHQAGEEFDKDALDDLIRRSVAERKPSPTAALSLPASPR